ncbi:BAF_HP2_G0015590.mRNA.1.CDS.1 [Saccharomyces cerevisiae]|nr:BAF_HP2_G0015590.mRNA.1.CDS.1 [Saccharomyces cerevisiae]CAI6598520.1 BAF_HP2_G0015590.mRNA.1.CDS.1 [Saccharomyces cerevisiae]
MADSHPQCQKELPTVENKKGRVHVKPVRCVNCSSPFQRIRLSREWLRNIVEAAAVKICPKLLLPEYALPKTTTSCTM